MMKAGKNYIVKGDPTEDEPEDDRSKYLRELCSSMLAAFTPVPAQPEEQPAAKQANKNRPTLKLTR